LALIKPDVVKENHIGEVITRFEKGGLWVAAIKMITLNKEQVSQFFLLQNKVADPAMFDYLASGPIIVMVLEGYNAIERSKELIGTADPLQAKKGTIRADFGETPIRNAIYGSDNPQAAVNEITFFFPPDEIQNRNRSI
jgi:nucleoside-diphosphate kinase